MGSSRAPLHFIILSSSQATQSDGQKGLQMYVCIICKDFYWRAAIISSSCTTLYNTPPKKPTCMCALREAENCPQVANKCFVSGVSTSNARVTPLLTVGSSKAKFHTIWVSKGHPKQSSVRGSYLLQMFDQNFSWGSSMDQIWCLSNPKDTLIWLYKMIRNNVI